MKNSVPEPSAAASSTLASTFCCQSTVADAVVATTPIAANVTTAAENAIQRSLLLVQPVNTHLRDRDPRVNLLRAAMHIREPRSASAPRECTTFAAKCKSGFLLVETSRFLPRIAENRGSRLAKVTYQSV